MFQPFMGEIRIFPFAFAPRGWAVCNGQLLQTAQFRALFAVIGTNYGGDGVTTFALPNLQGSVAMCAGDGPGLQSFTLGEAGGVPTVTLTGDQMATHTHALRAAVDSGDLNAPSTSRVLARANGGFLYQTNVSGLGALDPGACDVQGGGQPHNNLMPYVTLSFCIALDGQYPGRG